MRKSNVDYLRQRSSRLAVGVVSIATFATICAVTVPLANAQRGPHVDLHGRDFHHFSPRELHAWRGGWGGIVSDLPDAARQLDGEGISPEVIDVATLVPLDVETILGSVAKTGRCVICHETPLTGGFGTEIAARLAGPGLLSLLAPVERVTGYDTIMPLPRLEDLYTPGTKRILAAARRAMRHA